MAYNEILEYLFAQLPMYQRQGPAAYKANLDNTIAICSMLGNPEKNLKVVHVAGTNGKGSVSHMIASVLQKAGYKTGLYTSPHFKDFRERIRINGDMIPHDSVIDFVDRYRQEWKPLNPSFFEITVGMAFWYFAQEEVDIVVIETGLGGRLDSTNVCLPEVSVITNVSMDHMNLLGDTIEAIATEKAGIIKAGVPVVIGATSEESARVIAAKAAEMGSELIRAIDANTEIPRTDLEGNYQKENAQTALTTLRVLKKRGWELEYDHVEQGFISVAATTGIKGRWQQLGEAPWIFADAGHNEEGVKVLLEEMKNYHFTDLHFVIGMVKDKSIDQILSMLPKEASYYFCKADIPRGLPAEELLEQAKCHGLRGEIFPSVRRAFEAARLYAKAEDMIFVGGSVFTVAEVL
ncbi:MAG: dihydrofolate synthase/folylpolyglutamate synthase [Flavobacteriales bacterium]|jgi:dihydrofolate synthase/folylpolyglutamate synthase